MGTIDEGSRRAESSQNQDGPTALSVSLPFVRQLSLDDGPPAPASVAGGKREEKNHSDGASFFSGRLGSSQTGKVTSQPFQTSAPLTGLSVFQTSAGHAFLLHASLEKHLPLRPCVCRTLPPSGLQSGLWLQDPTRTCPTA